MEKNLPTNTPQVILRRHYDAAINRISKLEMTS